MLDEYLLHHNCDVPKKSPLSSDYECGVVGENHIWVSRTGQISAAWVYGHARASACIANAGEWANYRKVRSMRQGWFFFLGQGVIRGRSLADRFSRASGSRFGRFPEPSRVRG